MADMEAPVEREPIYYPPSPHQEHMALLHTLLTYVRSMEDRLKDIERNTRKRNAT
jgi:hypothetical protein